MIEVLYDSFSLQSNGIHISSLGHNSTPPRELQIEDIAGADGGILVESRYRTREIPVSGTIIADSQSELETLIQDFKRALNKSSKELRITDEDSLVTWIATPSTISINRERGLNYCEFSFSFVCPNPFGEYGVGTVLLSSSGVTASGTLALEVEGSYKAEPSIVLTLNSFTGAGDRSIIIQNGKTFAGITIERTWTAGDEVEIDSKNLTVKVNGSEIDPSGLFPSWEVGLGTLYYTDTFSARNVDIIATYTKRKI